MIITRKDHKHEKTAVEELLQKFSWKNQPSTEFIVKEDVEHNDYSSQIMTTISKNDYFSNLTMSKNDFFFCIIFLFMKFFGFVKNNITMSTKYFFL